MVNSCFRHCFKSVSSDLNPDVPWARWIPSLPHYLVSIGKWSPPGHFDWISILMLRWSTLVLTHQDRQPCSLSFCLVEISSQGPHTVCFITRQVTGRGAVLCYLAELSKPVRSGIHWAATISSAGTHEAGFGDQWCKQKGWIWWFYSSIFYVPKEFLSEKSFLCYSCKAFVQDVPLWSVSFSLGLQGTGYPSEQIFCLRNSVWLEEKCWVSVNPISFALFPLKWKLALFDLFLQNNVDKKTSRYLCVWDVSVPLQ